MSDSNVALQDLFVVELCSGVAGAYAGKLLADLGAKVALVEPEGGSPLRRRGPFAPGRPDGALFEHLNGGKSSMQVDSRALLADVVAAADVLLVDGTSSLEPQLPAIRPPQLVEVQFSPFGRTGPYAGWKGSDLATWAMGGYLYFTGSPSREPIWLPGSQASLHAGVNGAFAALAGLTERRASGFGQAVEVSELESVLCAHAWLVSSWAACGVKLSRVEHDLIRADDGWVYFMRIAPNDNLFVLIERFDMAEENLTADIPTWMANVPRIFEAAIEWSKDKTVANIVEFAQELRVAVTPVLDADGVYNDPQLAARSWWEKTDKDAIAFPGQPYRLSATPARRRGPAPAIGADTAAITKHVQGKARALTMPIGAPVAEQPLKGIRVVEVTGNWAGPVAGRHLADLGADVVKVEWARRPATRALFWPGPAQDLQRQPHHRALYFNEMNRNKRDVSIDLSTPRGREVFLELVKTADIVIENNSARVMPNLGLDWPALQAVNPRLIMVSMSGYGADGPRRDWVAYGSNIETTCGLTSITGYPDGIMSRTTLFYADPISGIHGALAALAALDHRRRTGEGQWIEMGLNEVGAAFCAEALLDRSATGYVRQPNGNRDPRFAPHGVYRCIGTDNWVAIAVQSDDDWRALADVIGRADLAADPALGTLEGRQAREDELDAAIGAWTAGLEQYEIAWALQRRGVSAAPVLANWQMLPDPHLYHRGMFESIEHPVVGVYPTTTWAWKFARTPGRLTRHAPLFAEQNREILHEIGLTEDQIAELYASGVSADDPEG